MSRLYRIPQSCCRSVTITKYIYIYLQYHSDCPLVGIGTPPPSPQRVCTSHLNQRGGGMLVYGWGGGGVPIPTREEKKLSSLPTLWSWWIQIFLLFSFLIFHCCLYSFMPLFSKLFSCLFFLILLEIIDKIRVVVLLSLHVLFLFLFLRPLSMFQ